MVPPNKRSGRWPNLLDSRKLQVHKSWQASCNAETSLTPRRSGSGKAAELRETVAALGADTVICDGELTPGQLQQLEKVLHVKVVDRTWLILDIFAQHARSREGKGTSRAGSDELHASLGFVAGVTR